MKKTSLILSLVILLIFVLGGFVFAQATKDRTLEVEYPKILGYEIEKTTTSIPEYVRYVYFFIIGISGLVALLVLTYAGFTYFTSAGSPEKIRDAKDQIAAAFLGLIILFCSYLIVTWINPELTMLRVASLETYIPGLSPGVWLCEKKVGIVDAWYKIINYETADSERRKEIAKELKSIFSDIDKFCYQEVTSYGTYVPEFFKKIKQGSYVYLIPLMEGAKYEEYGAILYEEPDHKGKTQIVYEALTGRAAAPTETEITRISKLSSIITFRLIPPDSKGACLYQYPNYNKDDPGIPACYPYKWTDWIIGPIETIKSDLGGHSPQSIEITGDVIAILSKGEEYAVFTGSDPNLLDNEEITEKQCTGHLWWRECIKIPVAESLQLISGSIYMW